MRDAPTHEAGEAQAASLIESLGEIPITPSSMPTSKAHTALRIILLILHEMLGSDPSLDLPGSVRFELPATFFQGLLPVVSGWGYVEVVDQEPHEVF